MNISSISSVTSNPQPLALPTPTQADGSTDGTATRPHGAHHRHHHGPKAGKATESVADPEQDGDQDNASFVTRLADRIQTRLQHAINSGKFTSDQVAALKDAAAKFQDSMTRIGNAGTTNETRREVHVALHQLGQQLQPIFSAQAATPSTASATDADGSDIAAANTAPPIDTVA
jgi:hypothetical protein